MDRKPKPEPGSPPGFPSSDYGDFNNMTIRELVSVLRGAYLMKDFDRVEEVLVSRDESLNAENGKLREKAEMERLARIQAEEESRNLCEKGKRLQESYERLLKNVKVNGFADNDVLRKKITELENQVNDFTKLKEKMKDDHKNTMDDLRNKNFELVSELYELRDLNEKWEKDSNALADLKIRVSLLEEDKKCLEIKNGELEEAVTKHSATIGELRDHKRKLVTEKREIEILAESLRVRFGELNGRVTRLEDDTKLLMTAGGNNEADPKDSIFQDNDEEDVRDYEFENDTMEPLQKSKYTLHSLRPHGTAQPTNKGSKDAQRASSDEGRLELEKGIDIIDLEDEDDDDDLSQGLQGKKDLSKVSVRNEHPSSSMTIQQKSISANGQLDTIKRKISFSDSSDSSTSSSSDDDLPLSSKLLHTNRKKPRQTVQD